MEWITDLETWIALATLTFLEIVLGVDNIIFISILSGKLPAGQQRRARRWGLIGAMLTRVLLLFSLAWIVKLTTPLRCSGAGPSTPVHSPPRRTSTTGTTRSSVALTGLASPGPEICADMPIRRRCNDATGTVARNVVCCGS